MRSNTLTRVSNNPGAVHKSSSRSFRSAAAAEPAPVKRHAKSSPAGLLLAQSISRINVLKRFVATFSTANP